MPDFSVLPVSTCKTTSQHSYDSVHPALPSIRSTCDGVPGNNSNCHGRGGLLLLAAVVGIAPEGAALLYHI